MTRRRFTFPNYLACRFVIMTVRLRLKFRVTSLNIREFKQIATAGSDTATGSKFPPK